MRAAGFAVDGVETCEDARHASASYPYDVIVLDLGLPDGDGLALVSDLKANGSETPILICTARDALDQRLAGLNGGADDYLVKPFAIEELVARLKALLRRPGSVLGVTLSAGNTVFETEDRRVLIDGRTYAFSSRETALLELFLRRADRVISKDAIENALYGFDEPPTPNAIEVLTHRLRKKLADNGATIEICNLRGIGYVLRDGAA